MSQFSTNETVSLEKRIEINPNTSKTSPENINSVYEIDRCGKWILENGFKTVCLQFPDNLLVDSSEIVHRIEQIVYRKVYILGDTAYESCCIDYTAANHISADAIIHFGQICFSKTENIIPCLKIYEKYDIDNNILCTDILNKFTDTQNVVVIINTPYLHKIATLRKKLNNFKILSVEENIDVVDKIIIYVGQNDRKLMNIYLSLNASELYFFDPQTSKELQKYELDTKILKRRYFLIEKIKDSNTIGIVINTLAVKNYLKVLDRIKEIIKVHSKKYYVISVGKPTVAKLANFPEVDIFVVIGCAMNEIYENREFYKPIVTPFDLESALNPKLHNQKFSYDFNNFLPEFNNITTDILRDYKQNDISLLTGNIRASVSNTEETNEAENTNETGDSRLVVRNEGKLLVSDNFGAGFLTNRSWTGLEQNLGKDEPQLAQQGRKGIAQNYENEIE